MMNVTLFLFIICSFALCAWAEHPADMNARHDVDFALVLTTVTFKLMLNDMLPRISYVTNLDLYVMAGFCFLTLATISHSMLPLFFAQHTDMSPLTFPPESFE